VLELEQRLKLLMMRETSRGCSASCPGAMRSTSMSTVGSQRGELLPSCTPALLRVCQLTEMDCPTARLLPAAGLLKLRRGALMMSATGRLCTEEEAPPEAEAAESCSQ
jgi:hypothetical protein